MKDGVRWMHGARMDGVKDGCGDGKGLSEIGELEFGLS
jgi:hypothetical protein